MHDALAYSVERTGYDAVGTMTADSIDEIVIAALTTF